MRLPSLKLFIILLLGCFRLVSAQYTIPAKPAVLYPVYDEAGLLSDHEKQLLNDKLIKYSDSTSTEIEVIIIPSTKGEDVNFLATMFGEKWGIGQKDKDNGVVFLIATEDHTMAIQQGRAVEQYLTASVAGQILDYLVTPYFKKGEWYQGIDHGTSAIIDALQGKFKAQPKSTNNGDTSVFKILLMIFVVMVIISIISRNNRGGGSNNDDDDVILSRRGRRSYPGGFFPFPGSFGGGSFGGGGFGSGGGFGGFGGGGSFGGGGASGGW